MSEPQGSPPDWRTEYVLAQAGPGHVMPRVGYIVPEGYRARVVIQLAPIIPRPDAFEVALW